MDHDLGTILNDLDICGAFGKPFVLNAGEAQSLRLHVMALAHAEAERDAARTDNAALKDQLHDTLNAAHALRLAARDLVAVVEMDDDYAEVGSDEWTALKLTQYALQDLDKEACADHDEPAQPFPALVDYPRAVAVNAAVGQKGEPR